MHAVYVGLNQWAVQRLKGLWEKLPTKWEKRYGRVRPNLQSQVELSRDARCCAASTKWTWPTMDDARLLNLEQEALRGRRAALRASLPARRVR
jgi:hypothetical protein